MEGRECKIFTEVEKCNTLTTEIWMSGLKYLEGKKNSKIEGYKDAYMLLTMFILHIQRQH